MLEDESNSLDFYIPAVRNMTEFKADEAGRLERREAARTARNQAAEARRTRAANQDPLASFKPRAAAKKRKK